MFLFDHLCAFFVLIHSHYTEKSDQINNNNNNNNKIVSTRGKTINKGLELQRLSE